MLKREITYENFDGEEVSDIYYFNLSKAELVELAVEVEGGFGAFLQRIVDEKDNKELVKQFKEIILMAYGVKSADGKSFLKNDELREAFSQTAAFQSLFMELLEVEKAAADFTTGIMPKNLNMPVDQDKPAALSNN